MRKAVFVMCEQQDADQTARITDQLAHLRSLISTFVVCCLDSIISLVSVSELSSLYLASVAAQASLCPTWLQTLKTGFLVTRLIRKNKSTG